MCEEWSNDFSAFLDHMGTCPAGMTLDRINNDRGYEPGNCRWATMKQQANNTSRNVFLTCEGLTMSVEEWSNLTGIKAGTIYHRHKIGWPIELVLDHTLTVSQAIKITKMVKGIL